MDSRPILKDAKKILVHLDSITFEDLLNRDNRLAVAILRYYNSNYLELTRSTLNTTHNELKNVVEYELISAS